jgi:branched-chain amino acid transport system permease protein
VASRSPRASGYFRTGYAQDFALTQTRLERASLLAFATLLAVYPFAASAFYLDLACQVFLAAIGALALMLLTGYAGQVSLGHAGLLSAGAFTVGILFREVGAPFWITLPAAAVVGALLGVAFGLPSLRLRGLYLAVSTLALHSSSSISAASTRAGAASRPASRSIRRASPAMRSPARASGTSCCWRLPRARC